METADQTFRRAAIGGFNRQDVLNYIELAARTAAGKEEALEKEIASLKGAGDHSDTAARTAGERAEHSEARLAEASTRLEEQSAALAQYQESLERERAESRRLSEELGRMRDKTSRMESGATAYAELRDRTGTIELEAHQRALLIQQAAEERARNIQAEGAESARRLRIEAEQLIGRVRAEYTRLRQGLDSAAGAAALELDRVGQTMEEVKAEFSAHDDAFVKLLDACRHQPESGKEPKPLPLVE